MLKEVETEQQGAEAALDAGSALNNTATPQYSGSDVTVDPLCRISLESCSRARGVVVVCSDARPDRLIGPL